MSIELEPEEPVEIPLTVIWRPEWIPPACPAGCFTGCEPMYGITIYQLNVHLGHHIEEGRTGAIVAAFAYEYYFDRYGCRRTGPPPRREDITTIRNLTVRFAGLHAFQPDRMWPECKRRLLQAGAPPPGHVRLLPKWRDGLTHLAALRGYLRP